VWGAKSTDVACKSVYNYLNNLSSKTDTYTDALWQSGDDGPWRLTAFDNLGNLTSSRTTVLRTGEGQG